MHTHNYICIIDIETVEKKHADEIVKMLQLIEEVGEKIVQ